MASVGSVGHKVPRNFFTFTGRYGLNQYRHVQPEQTTHGQSRTIIVFRDVVHQGVTDGGGHGVEASDGDGTTSHFFLFVFGPRLGPGSIAPIFLAL